MKKIIIAEPVLHDIEKSGTLFGRGGITVFPARTSEDILALHRASKADLIVMDFALPVMDSVRLCSLIRGDADLKDVSLIVVCDPTETSQAQSLQAGANAVMAKPVAPFELFSRISELLVIPLRKDLRALLRVSVARGEGTTSFLGVSRNLSISGMLLEAEPELQKGERLAFTADIGNREIAAEGEVIRVEIAAPGKFHYGVKFSNLDMKSLVLIEQLVKGRIRQ
jgi:CheY-like chemotaxis protein